MFLPTLIFLAFSALSAAGAYLIIAHRRSRLAGIGAALLTILFFAALYAGMIALMRGGGAL